MTAQLPESQIIKFTCSKDDDQKILVDLIAQRSSLSKSLIKKLMTFGSVFQTTNNTRKRFRKAKNYAKEGDKIECYFDEKIDLDQMFDFRNLYETKYFGIYHKPVGALTEGTNYGDKISLLRHVEKNKKRAYLVNRLDKETEGLVVIAYDSKTQNLLQQMWRNKVTKKYQAIVLGELEDNGEFDFPINGKVAQTKYRSIKTVDGNSYIEVSPVTERKHQIRIHFSNFGHPVIGDPIYGRNNKNIEGLQLVAYSLRFINPYTESEIRISLPKDSLLF